jgi:LysM repeat protein
MKFKLTNLILLGSLILTLGLTGCKLAASKAPPATPTVDFPFPLGTQPADAMKSVLSQTQTAVAAPVGDQATQATAKEVAATSDSQAVQATAEPKPVYNRETNPKRPATYTLQAGEWPICIARRYNLNVGSLLSANGLTMDSKPGAGTSLNIPSSGTWDSGTRAYHSHPTSYTVKGGDTINIIACYYGDLLPDDIIGANGLSKPYSLSAGKVLSIP